MQAYLFSQLAYLPLAVVEGHNSQTHFPNLKPDVVITFDPNGAYGHPNHIAISQFSTAAMVSAAMPNSFEAQLGLPHQVSKLYYFTESELDWAMYEELFGDGCRWGRTPLISLAQLGDYD